MKILFLTDYFPKPSNSAMGTWALDQARGLQDAGVEVRVLSYNTWFPRWVTSLTGKGGSYSDCPVEYTIEGLEVTAPRWFYLPMYRVRVLLESVVEQEYRLLWKLSGKALLDEVERFKPDAIYAHHTLPNGYFAWRCFKETGVPYVLADFDFNTINGCRTRPAKKALFTKIKNDALLNVPASNQMAEDVAEIFPDCRVEAIHHGLARSVIEQGKAACEPATPVLFSACVFYHRKGLGDLISAFEKAAEKNSEIVLRLAGDGEERAMVEAQIAESPVKDRITLLGKISREEVYEEMSRATLFILLGWDEPFATVYLESMAHGLPIIACDDGGINDVVDSGVNGFFVPPREPAKAAEAILKLVSDPALRSEISVNNRRLMEECLNLDVFGARLKAVFQSA